MRIEGSALSAMAALRAQIEERLLQTEDYRAFRALERAINDVSPAPRPAMPQASAAPSLPAASEGVGLLQQRLAERYDPVAA